MKDERNLWEVKHYFEPTFYIMWVWTIAFLGIMAYVAVGHL